MMVCCLLQQCRFSECHQWHQHSQVELIMVIHLRSINSLHDFGKGCICKKELGQSNLRSNCNWERKLQPASADFSY